MLNSLTAALTDKFALGAKSIFEKIKGFYLRLILWNIWEIQNTNKYGTYKC